MAIIINIYFFDLCSGLVWFIFIFLFNSSDSRDLNFYAYFHMCNVLTNPIWREHEFISIAHTHQHTHKTNIEHNNQKRTKKNEKKNTTLWQSQTQR